MSQRALHFLTDDQCASGTPSAVLEYVLPQTDHLPVAPQLTAQAHHQTWE